MSLHKKPTPEELEEGMKKAVDEAEVKEKVEEKEEEEVKEKVKEVEKPKEQPDEETKEEVDYKKKFVDSSKEAIILHHKNKATNEAIDKAIETPEPTEDELQRENPDWDVMSDFEKKMAKDSLWNTRRFTQLDEIRKSNRDVEKWGESVEKFTDDPKNLVTYPELEGKVDEFRLFASGKSRMNIDFDVLVGAFLHDSTKKAKPKSKGSMFDSGTGGSSNKDKNAGKLSLTEGRRLMQTDYKEWRRLMNAGKIQMDVE